MKMLKLILVVACSLVSLSQQCWGVEDKNNRDYKRKVAGFYKEINNNKPSMYNLIRISNNSGLTPEELISVLDKNNSCDMDEKELISFIEKWSRKRHQKMSEETKRFADRAFNFIDDDHDGVILGRELLPAQKTANDYAYLGSAAESVFGYF